MKRPQKDPYPPQYVSLSNMIKLRCTRSSSNSLFRSRGWSLGGPLHFGSQARQCPQCHCLPQAQTRRSSAPATTQEFSSFARSGSRHLIGVRLRTTANEGLVTCREGRQRRNSRWLCDDERDRGVKSLETSWWGAWAQSCHRLPKPHQLDHQPHRS